MSKKGKKIMLLVVFFTLLCLPFLGYGVGWWSHGFALTFFLGSVVIDAFLIPVALYLEGRSGGMIY